MRRIFWMDQRIMYGESRLLSPILRRDRGVGVMTDCGQHSEGGHDA